MTLADILKNATEVSIFDLLAEAPRESAFIAPVSAETAKGFISLNFTIWCGTCSEWQPIGGKRIREGGHAAKSMGWRRNRITGWRCPDCIRKNANIDLFSPGFSSAARNRVLTPFLRSYGSPPPTEDSPES